ncbi:hypothetical protein ACWD00_29255 [Streptomyces viridiviolaceus]
MRPVDQARSARSWQALRDGEGILTAELDLDDLPRARFDFDPTGHYARPDVFTLHADETARTTVAGLSDQAAGGR